MTKLFKDLLEDVYAADRGEKQWVDPKTGKTKKRVIQAHRIQFAASKLHKGKGEEDERPEYLKVKEEVESIDEISKELANSYMHSAMYDRKQNDEKVSKALEKNRKQFSMRRHKNISKLLDKSEKRSTGIQSALNRLKKEHMEQLTQELHEVLSKDAKAGDWIHDFVHSDNPKFAGKSKKERIRMALGAYYAKQQNEETDTVVKDKEGKVKSWKHIGDWKKVNPKKNPEGKVHNLAGQALKKTQELNKEEAEQIDEKSDQARRNKTWKNLMDASRGARTNKDVGLTPDLTGHKTNQQMNKAIGRAVRRGEMCESELEEARYGRGDSYTRDYRSSVSGFGRREREDDEYHVPDPTPARRPMYPANNPTNTPKPPAKPEEKKAVKEDFCPACEQDPCVCGGNHISEMSKYLVALGGDMNFSKAMSEGYGTHGEDKKEEEEDVKLIKKMVKKDALKTEEAYKGLEKEDKPGEVATEFKGAKNSVSGKTVEGWKDTKKVKKESEEMAKTYKDFINEMEFVNGKYTHKGTYGYGGKGAAYGQTDYDKENLDAKDDKEYAGAKRGPKAGSKRGPKKILGTSKLHTK